MDMDRLSERALAANKKLQAEREATDLEVTKKAVDDFRDDIDRKVLAYTSVADMSPEDFRRMIDGHWKVRFGQVSDDLSQLSPDDISHRVRRWARKEADMFSDDISPATDDISQSDFERRREEARRRAIQRQTQRPDVFAEIGTSYRPSIGRQVWEIMKSAGRVVRAYVKGIP